MGTEKLDSRAVANYFLDKAEEEEIDIDHLKLQKLVYLAHGWYLAKTGQPLFAQSVQAWPHGPVIPALYQEFKTYGAGPIAYKAYDYKPELDGIAEYSLDDAAMSEAERERVVSILDEVWDRYKGKTSLELSKLTHRKDSPWDLKAGKLSREEFKNVSIDNEVIRNYYSTELAK